MADASNDLDSTLAELDSFVHSEHPGLYPRFRPGLTDLEIGHLAERLDPYQLPTELVVLYRWHDGWDAFADGDYVELLPDAGFNSLWVAIDEHEAWWEAVGSEGWHPLWFPAFGGQHGELVALQLDRDRAAGQVFSFHSEMDLSTSYDSVSALFETTLACWRQRLLPGEEYFTPEFHQLVARHNPLSRTPDGRPLREISRFDTDAWPTVWKDTLGAKPG
jgi:cell wall assembly regulator SMI1